MLIPNKNLQKEESIQLDFVSKSIVKSILYFDLFQHPLSFQDLKEYNTSKLTDDCLKKSLHQLIDLNILTEERNYYFLSNSNKNNVQRRIDGEKMANKYMKIANAMSNLISWFPFVRGVCISGTLSKNYFDSEADIDYFIITAPKRLWLCRSLLIAFKKIFLLNSKKYFCVNYFIDSDNLTIPDKNIFTATELSHVKPTYNQFQYKQLIEANEWIAEFYPNKELCLNASLNSKQNLVKLYFEKILSGNIGERLDNWCFQSTIKHWKKKFSEFNENEFDTNLRSRKNVSKHHPRGFQFKVLKEYNDKIIWFETTYNINLS